jgi:hypothetical protein
MAPDNETNLARRESDGVVIKAFGHLDVKDEAKGEVEAVIATLNTVDRDGDVILSDAIKSGSRVILSSYGHNTVGSLFGDGGTFPAGKGKIIIDENKAVFQGHTFMDMQIGRDTLSMLKHMGADQEWSFGFRVIGSEVPDETWRKRGAERILTKLDCFEVSPVLIGAGVGTRTVSAKAADEEAAQAKAEREAVEEKERQDAAAALEAKRVADEAATLETKRLADEAARKERVTEAMAEHERVQRTLKRMGLVA